MSRDGSVSAVKTRARCYCRPLLSNPLLQFPQRKLHLSLRFTAPCLGLLQFLIYAQAWYAPPHPKKKMIQHAGSSVLHVVCLPRGLESCRYGGTVGVAFSELGPDSNGDRSSMPSEAMSFTVREAAGRLLAAPSLHSARRSSRRLVVGAVLLPVQQLRWRQAGGGGAPRWSPPPHWHDPGRCSESVRS